MLVVLVVTLVCCVLCVAGYVCEEHNNPSDFFLDILNGCLNPVCSTESDQYASEICPSTGGLLSQHSQLTQLGL